MDGNLASQAQQSKDGDAWTLETLLTNSIATASRHTKDIFGSDTMTPGEVETFLSKRTAVAVATTDREGRPLIADADLIFLEGRFFIGQSRGSATLNQIRKTQRVALLLMQGWRRHLLLEGQASCLADNDPVNMKVRAAEKRRIGFTSQVIVEVHPSRMFGWKSDGPPATIRAGE